MTFDIVIELYICVSMICISFWIPINDIKTTYKRHTNDIDSTYWQHQFDFLRSYIAHLFAILHSITLGCLNFRCTEPFLIATRYLSIKFSREFWSLLPVNSDFTLTKPLNSLENFRLTYNLSFTFQTPIHHFTACKPFHLSRFYVISMSFLCRFYVIKPCFCLNVYTWYSSG